MISQDKTLIVVPTYNEVDSIGELLRGIYAVAPRVSVLVVDDNSQDGTLERVKEYKAQSGNAVDWLSRGGKLGLGTAYIAGFQWGLDRGFDYLIEMDADLSHDPRYLTAMFATLHDYDVAVGSRYVRGGGTVNWGWLRKVISRGGSLYARTVLNEKVKDFTGGFNGWRRLVLESIDLNQVKSEGYSFQIELKFRALRQGFRLREFPIIFRDRTVGQSKMSGAIVREAMWRVLLFRISAPKRRKLVFVSEQLTQRGQS